MAQAAAQMYLKAMTIADKNIMLAAQAKVIASPAQYSVSKTIYCIG
jgi:hypothetical protein